MPETSRPPPGTTVKVENSGRRRRRIPLPQPAARPAGAVAVTRQRLAAALVSKVEFYVDGYRFAEDTTAPYTGDAGHDARRGAAGSTTARTADDAAYDDHDRGDRPRPTARSRSPTPQHDVYAATSASTAAPQAVTYDPAAATQDEVRPRRHRHEHAARQRGARPTSCSARWISPTRSRRRSRAPRCRSARRCRRAQSRRLRVIVEPPALPDGRREGAVPAAASTSSTRRPRCVRRQGQQAAREPGDRQQGARDGARPREVLPVRRRGARRGHAARSSTSPTATRSCAGRRSVARPRLSTSLDLTYNSLEKKSESPAGNNFSLSISSLSRFGNPIDVHPEQGRRDRAAAPTSSSTSPTATARPTASSGRQAADGSTYWEEPAGVHLYLRSPRTTDPARRWALTRPDRVTFFFDVGRLPDLVEDGNGNRLTFTLEATPPGEDPGGPEAAHHAGHGRRRARRSRHVLLEGRHEEAAHPRQGQADHRPHRQRARLRLLRGRQPAAG